MTIVEHTLNKECIEKFQKEIKRNVDDLIEEIYDEMKSLDARSLELKEGEELSIDFDEVMREIEPLITIIKKHYKRLNNKIESVRSIFWWESL